MFLFYCGNGACWGYVGVEMIKGIYEKIRGGFMKSTVIEGHQALKIPCLITTIVGEIYLLFEIIDSPVANGKAFRALTMGKTSENNKKWEEVIFDPSKGFELFNGQIILEND